MYTHTAHELPPSRFPRAQETWDWQPNNTWMGKLRPIQRVSVQYIKDVVLQGKVRTRPGGVLLGRVRKRRKRAGCCCTSLLPAVSLPRLGKLSSCCSAPLLLPP